VSYLLLADAHTFVCRSLAGEPDVFEDVDAVETF
jgi:hypothetical protein